MFGTWDFTAHVIGCNYFLEKIILLVIKKIADQCPDATVINTWKFTAQGKG
jgi:hypothetical protein